MSVAVADTDKEDEKKSDLTAVYVSGCKRSYDTCTSLSDGRCSLGVTGELKKLETKSTGISEEDQLWSSLEQLSLRPHKRLRRLYCKSDTTVVELFQAIRRKPNRTVVRRSIPVHAFPVRTVAIRDVTLLPPYAPFPHQIKHAESLLNYETYGLAIKSFNRERGGLLLASQAGLGKTLVMLLVVRATLSLQREKQCPTLFVTPKHLMGQLQQQIQVFFGSAISVTIYHSDFDRHVYKKCQGLSYPSDIVIVSYATLTSHFKSQSFPFLFQTEFYRIVYDEVHTLRKANECHKVCLALRARHVHGMSGTIVHDTLRDLVNCLIQVGLEPSVLYMRKNITKRFVLESGLVSRVLENTFAETEGITVPTCRFQQVSCGADMPTDDIEVSTHLESFHESKLHTVLEFLNRFLVTTGEEKLLLFSRTHSSFAAVYEAASLTVREAMVHFLQGEKTMNSAKKVFDHISEFQTQPAKRILCLTYRLGHVGFDLTQANHVGILQMHTSRSILQQSISRVYRIGQARPVSVSFFLHDHSPEETLYLKALPDLEYLFSVKKQHS